MYIEDYSFGRMVIEGETYSSDLLICDGQIKTNWWREEGHSLSLADLRWVLKEDPDVLIIGNGKSGVMTVPQDLQEQLESEVDLIVAKTAQAVKIFNQEQENNLTVAAGFHLTC